MDDIAIVYRADEPECEYAVAEDHGLSVAAVWDCGVGDLGGVEDVVVLFEVLIAATLVLESRRWWRVDDMGW